MGLHRRPAAVITAAMVVVAGGSACTEQDTKLPQPAARVTVNGSTRTTHAVSCTQVQWMLSIAITAGRAAVKAVVRLDGDKPTPTSVDITDFDGFTGNAGPTVGNVDVNFANNTYTLTGIAEGPNPANPSTPSAAVYRIDAACTGS